MVNTLDDRGVYFLIESCRIHDRYDFWKGLVFQSQNHKLRRFKGIDPTT